MGRILLYGVVDLQLTHSKQGFSLLFSSSVSSFSSMKFMNFSILLYLFVVVGIAIYVFSFGCNVYPVSIKLCISCSFLNRAHPSHSQSCTAMREQKTLMDWSFSLLIYPIRCKTREFNIVQDFRMNMYILCYISCLQTAPQTLPFLCSFQFIESFVTHIANKNSQSCIRFFFFNHPEVTVMLSVSF